MLMFNDANRRTLAAAVFLAMCLTSRAAPPLLDGNCVDGKYFNNPPEKYWRLSADIPDASAIASTFDSSSKDDAAKTKYVEDLLTLRMPGALEVLRQYGEYKGVVRACAS